MRNAQTIAIRILAITLLTAAIHCATPKANAQSPQRVIIDTDPGTDDALAILLALIPLN